MWHKKFEHKGFEVHLGHGCPVLCATGGWVFVSATVEPPADEPDGPTLTALADRLVDEYVKKAALLI